MFQTIELLLNFRCIALLYFLFAIRHLNTISLSPWAKRRAIQQEMKQLRPAKIPD